MTAPPTEQSHLLSSLTRSSSDDPMILIRHDSIFSVNSNYRTKVATSEETATITSSSSSQQQHHPPLLSMWQGAILLTADCLGTGLLALPGNLHTLGWGPGMIFLIAQFPINYYAGLIFHETAAAVEDQHAKENQQYQELLAQGKISFSPDNLHDASDDEPKQKIVVDQNSVSDLLESLLQQSSEGGQEKAKTPKVLVSPLVGHRLHHDTATMDFLGMAAALYKAVPTRLQSTGTETRPGNTQQPLQRRWIQWIYYTNIFLVLGNYVLVMSHALQAAFPTVCLPTAGGMACLVMYAVCQLNTMTQLGKKASIASLAALMVVLVLCLYYSRASINNDSSYPVHSTTPVTFLRQCSALGSIGFAVGSQKLFLNIRHELQDRSKAPTSLAWSLTCFGTLYVLIVIVAGPHPPDLLLDVIPHPINHNQWMSSKRLAGLCLFAHVVVSYAINAQALCSSLDRLLQPENSRKDDSSALLGWASKWSPRSRWMSLTAVVTISAYLVSNAIPFFTDLVSLIGAVTSVPLTLLLPALFYRRWHHWSEWTVWPCSASSALVWFSMVFMCTATVGSLDSILRDWSIHGSPFSCY